MSTLVSDMRPESRNNLFKQLGVLAQSVGWVRAGVPLGESIRKMMGRLSHAEIASFENGAGIPHHVMAYAAKQAAEAKKAQQEADAARNDAQKYLTIPHGMNEPFGRGGVLRAHWGLPDRRGGTGAAATATERSGANGLTIIDRWALEGTSIAATTGLSPATYNNLRAEGYSQAQISAAAGDLSKIRGFTPADVNRYTPYFVGTDKAFRNEAKQVIESNGTKRFKEDNKLTNALPQAVLTDDGKIQPHQMNSLGKAIYALPVNREELRKQRGEEAKHRYMIKKHRFNKNDYMRLSPDQKDKYLLDRGADPEKIKAGRRKASMELTVPDGNAAETQKTLRRDDKTKLADATRGETAADNALDRFVKLGAELPAQRKDASKSLTTSSTVAEKPSKSEAQSPPSSDKANKPPEQKRPEPKKAKMAGSVPSNG